MADYKTKIQRTMHLHQRLQVNANVVGFTNGLPRSARQDKTLVAHLKQAWKRKEPWVHVAGTPYDTKYYLGPGIYARYFLVDLGNRIALVRERPFPQSRVDIKDGLDGNVNILTANALMRMRPSIRRHLGKDIEKAQFADGQGNAFKAARKLKLILRAIENAEQTTAATVAAPTRLMPTTKPFAFFKRIKKLALGGH